MYVLMSDFISLVKLETDQIVCMNIYMIVHKRHIVRVKEKFGNIIRIVIGNNFILSDLVLARRAYRVFTYLYRNIRVDSVCEIYFDRRSCFVFATHGLRQTGSGLYTLLSL